MLLGLKCEKCDVLLRFGGEKLKKFKIICKIGVKLENRLKLNSMI